MLSTTYSTRPDKAQAAGDDSGAKRKAAPDNPSPAQERAASDPRASVRIAGVLTALAEADEQQSLSHIAAIAGLPVSTVHRILEQLVELGLVEKTANRQYGVGKEFSRIGALAAQKLDVARLARPLMQRIVEDCNETCLLGLYMPMRRKLAFVEKIDARYPLKYRVVMNVHRTLVWGASGRAVLAWLPQDDIDDILAQAEPSPGNPEKKPLPEEINETLAAVRARGYATSLGEQTASAVGIATPVFLSGKRVIGDLCLTIPAFRFDTSAQPHYAKLLLTAAAQLSRALGAPPAEARYFQGIRHAMA